MRPADVPDTLILKARLYLGGVCLCEDRAAHPGCPTDAQIRLVLTGALPVWGAKVLEDARDQIGAWPDDASVPVSVVRALLGERADDMTRGGQ